MRFLIGGIALFIVLSLIVGRIFSPRGSSFRTIFGRGFYYTAAATLSLAVVVGLGALIYYGIEGDKKIHDTSFFRGMNETQKAQYLDSLFNEVPNPSVAEIKTSLMNYRFNSKALPCYDALHAFDVASLEQILELEKQDTRSSDEIYEINTLGEFKTDRPEAGFHLQGTFVIQYTFSKGLQDVPPGWNFTKIYFTDCEVLSPHKKENKTSRRDSLYPDLKRP